MRLSKLHIAGFKSFPDRAELGFGDGVTAIVGPNGCGKSNVVDAITWVLGEQSAKSLRGERMEDVIFNGSEGRKPTATAEVRLKLSQVAQAGLVVASDDQLVDEPPVLVRDVEIGRRLYRSGESEYLIDGEVCRLRDVHDLLMDSGLGVKAYAVIEQGKIGQILSSRPAERRMLIEEAAGVTKYKSRRRAAELKLEAAQQNLTRVEDIVFEVEKQRGALKRQAARARRYRQLRDELRKWEQVQFARRSALLSRDVAAAEAAFEDASVRAAASAARVAELESALEAARLTLTEVEHAATAARDHAHGRELEIGRLQQQIAFNRHQIEDLARQADRFAAEVHELEERRGPAAETLAGRQAAAQEAQGALDGAGADVAAREAEYRVALSAVQVIEQDADRTRAAVMAATTTLSALRQARDHAATVRDRVAAELERLGVEARELAAEVERLGGQRDEQTHTLSSMREVLDAVRTRRAEAERTLAARRAEHERLSAELGRQERELAGRQARLRSLEELEASRATYGDAARLVLADTQAGIRQHGSVADHLDVERSYERAVDALAGELLQYVLVESHDDVRRALALLEERRAGRCGFLVLDRAQGVPPPFDAPSGARALADVVSGTGHEADAVLGALGQALIVNDYATAERLASAVSVPMATATGEVFRNGSLVQGGTRRDVQGILETRAEVSRLRDDVEAAREAVSTLTSALASTAEAAAADQQTVLALTADLHEREKAIVALDGQLSRLHEEHARVTRRLELVSTERARATEEQTAAEARRDEALAAIQTHEAEQRDAEASLGSVAARLQEARQAAEARSRLVTDSRTTQAALVERASALAAEVARLEDAQRELEARIVTRTSEIQHTDVRRRQLGEGIVELEGRLDEEVRAFEALKTDIRGLDERVTALRAEFTARDQAIREARHQFEKVRAEVGAAEVARAKAFADQEHLAATCLEAVGRTLEEVDAVVAELEARGDLVPPSRRSRPVTAEVSEEDEDLEAPADAAAGVEVAGEPEPVATSPDEIVALFRSRIDRLGPVNMMAIEQFDELESRHRFLTTQRQDLLDSIAQTGEAIRKIDKTTRERFAEAFESINRNFERTFSTLFGGGRAGLVLIDTENDQESGIDIIAQPPGKRLQNVQLLSGGEKALTAMALMFAVFTYRPSPFCLLDEIDAPLDDANIGRFVEMLRGMQAHTQFILITHNRKTMEIANRLYGVTMEEPGVSKLISLELN
ncbi:MAG: chromosome segregation protein SMC [Acidobacteria bacterium]|nr:chromosome segregation protein SMC [Acidobacteriota bacterium]